MGYWDRFEGAQTRGSSPWDRALSFSNAAARNPGAPTVHPSLNRTSFAGLSYEDDETYTPPDALTKYGSFPDKNPLSGLTVDEAATRPRRVTPLSDLSIPTEEPLSSEPQQLSRSQSLMNEYTSLQGLNPRDLDTNDDSMMTNVGKQLALSLRNLEAPLMNPNVSDKQAYGMALGNAIGAALTGIISPYDDERQTLDAQKQRKMQEVAIAQKMEQEDLQTRTGEAQIKGIEAQIGEREQKVLTAQNKIIEGQAKLNTDRLNAVTKLVKTGQLTKESYAELGSVISDIVGAKVNVDAPADTIKDVKIVSDAEGNRAFVVTTSKNGVVESQTIKDETGKTAYIKPDRIKAAEVAAAASTENTKIRTEADIKQTRLRIAAEVNAYKFKDAADVKKFKLGVAAKKAAGDIDADGEKAYMDAINDRYPEYKDQ